MFDFGNYNKVFSSDNSISSNEINTYTNNQILNYHTVPMNITQFNPLKNIAIENELFGLNSIYSRGVNQTFVMGDTEKLRDNRALVLNTPELLDSAASNIKKRKTCNTVSITETNRILNGLNYMPNPEYNYISNAHINLNSRELRRQTYKKK